MTTTTPRIGQLGIGAIGHIYLGHLKQAFGTVRVFDTDAQRLAEAAVDGVVAATSAVDLARTCDIIVVSLPNPWALKAAFEGEDGLLAGLAPGAVIVDTSTVSAEVNQEMYRRAAVLGAKYLDAPVSGGVPGEAGVEGARAASMTFMVGGDEDAVPAAQPVFDALGKEAVYLGPSGSGTKMKLISNLCSGLNLLVAAEAIAIGTKAGFSVEQIEYVFQRTDANSFLMLHYLFPRLKSGDIKPGFSVELQLKDHRLAEALAHEIQVSAPFNAMAVQTWQRLRAKGRSGNDVVDSTLFATEEADKPILHPHA